MSLITNQTLAKGRTTCYVKVAVSLNITEMQCGKMCQPLISSLFVHKNHAENDQQTQQDMIFKNTKKPENQLKKKVFRNERTLLLIKINT